MTPFELLINTMVEDHGLEKVLEDNELTEEDVFEILLKKGLIDTGLYLPETMKETYDD